jgi:RNA-directed DNA polymerase
VVGYADDFICTVQYADQAQRMIEALHKRFAKFDLELHPEKTRVTVL